MKIVKGNLIELAKNGEFNVIAHGCNCFCKQKSGLAKEMVKNFDTEYSDAKYDFLKEEFTLENPYTAGDINKLGQIQYEFRNILNYESRNILNNKYIYVVNCYTQYDYGRDPNKVYADYEAIALCFKKINHIFKGKKVGLPWIGCGLANGNREVITQLMSIYLNNVDLTVVEYE
jgi:O-acetyl-ADP-ribose deacetylase (regulator of RNase III)